MGRSKSVFISQRETPPLAISQCSQIWAPILHHMIICCHGTVIGASLGIMEQEAMTKLLYHNKAWAFKKPLPVVLFLIKDFVRFLSQGGGVGNLFGTTVNILTPVFFLSFSIIGLLVGKIMIYDFRPPCSLKLSLLSSHPTHRTSHFPKKYIITLLSYYWAGFQCFELEAHVDDRTFSRNLLLYILKLTLLLWMLHLLKANIQRKL